METPTKVSSIPKEGSDESGCNYSDSMSENMGP